MKNGLLFIDKEAGMTSRRIDNHLQKKFQIKKIGHLGTLDPFATGLMVIGIGSGTKALNYLDDETKSYVASLQLGYKSSTLDKDGEIIKGKEIINLNEKEISLILKTFIGIRRQTPPMTSAVKVDGTPLYKLAHQGKEIERKSRLVRIYSINLIHFDEEKMSIDFSCTVCKGTYIRVLGEEIAARLGGDGYLLSLRRSSIGPLTLALAKKLDKVEESDIVDPTLFLTRFHHAEITDDEYIRVKNGMSIEIPLEYGDKIALTKNGHLVAIYKRGRGLECLCERGME